VQSGLGDDAWSSEMIKILLPDTSIDEQKVPQHHHKLADAEGIDLCLRRTASANPSVTKFRETAAPRPQSSNLGDPELSGCKLPPRAPTAIRRIRWACRAFAGV
jgi:hypothetical protein